MHSFIRGQDPADSHGPAQKAVNRIKSSKTVSAAFQLGIFGDIPTDNIEIISLRQDPMSLIFHFPGIDPGLAAEFVITDNDHFPFCRSINDRQIQSGCFFDVQLKFFRCLINRFRLILPDINRTASKFEVSRELQTH